MMIFIKMKIVKVLFWVLLVNGIYSLNSIDKTNADDNSSASLFVPTPKEMCDGAAAKATTIEDFNSTSSKLFNITWKSNLSEDTEEATDFYVKQKIKYYNLLERKIW